MMQPSQARGRLFKVVLSHDKAEQQSVTETNRRYAVEIRGFCAHAETDDLAEILEVLDGLTGRVHVIDRVSRSLMYEGTVNEVYDAIVATSANDEQEVTQCPQRM